MDYSRRTESPHEVDEPELALERQLGKAREYNA